MANKLPFAVLLPLLLAFVISASPPDDRYFSKSMECSAKIGAIMIQESTDPKKPPKKALMRGTATYVGYDYLISARHVVMDESLKPYSRIYAYKDGEEFDLEVVDYGKGDTPSDDWALLRSTCKHTDHLPYKPTRIMLQPESGSYIYRIGNDMGAGLVAAMGVLGQEEANVWSSNMPGRPGASGGGVFINGYQFGILSGAPVHQFGFNMFFDTSMCYVVDIEGYMFNKMPKKPAGVR